MKTTIRDLAGRLAGTVREMNEAQRRLLALRTSVDHYTENSGRAPDTYAEFLARTSGTLLPEPSARKRAGRARW